MREKIKMVSSAGTGHFYTTTKNKRTTPDKLEMRLSNLMAFDATMAGNWGCDPLLYADVLKWIAEGRIQVSPFVEKHPLAEINQVLDAAHAGKLLKRAVLVP